MEKYPIGTRLRRKDNGNPYNEIVIKKISKGERHPYWTDSNVIWSKQYLDRNYIIVTETPRKDIPVFSGVLKYFPDAILEVTKASLGGKTQHNPDKPLHWDRTKSSDEEDALTRHLIDVAKGIKFDTDGVRHKAKIAWRALAMLQKEIENDRNNIQGTEE